MGSARLMDIGSVLMQWAGGLMPSSRRYSTCTVRSDGRVVPWLAASGPLSYTPESPPQSDYYFQYSWIIPDIFDPDTNKRHHFYFGAQFKEHAKELLSFWRAATEGRADSVACHIGGVSAEARITAPVAIYLVRDAADRACYLLMQHGSYQLVPAADQPLLRSGEVVLYRGVQRSSAFRFLRVGQGSLDARWRRVWQSYIRAQSRMLSDSVLSFNTIHDRARRCETGHIRGDGSWISDEIAREEGMDLGGDHLASALWNAAHQSFSLARWVGQRKFDPHFVAGKTPISNLRLTTFFAGEHEVRIVDPDLVEFIDARGCRVERPTSTSWARRYYHSQAAATGSGCTASSPMSTRGRPRPGCHSTGKVPGSTIPCRGPA